MQTILVVGEYGPQGKQQVCVWERHPAHEAFPDGELYIVSGQTAAVAMTPGVVLALEQKRLKPVELVDPADPVVETKEPETFPSEKPEIAVAESSAPKVSHRGRK